MKSVGWIFPLMMILMYAGYTSSAQEIGCVTMSGMAVKGTILSVSPSLLVVDGRIISGEKRDSTGVFTFAPEDLRYASYEGPKENGTLVGAVIGRVVGSTLSRLLIGDGLELQDASELTGPVIIVAVPVTVYGVLAWLIGNRIAEGDRGVDCEINGDPQRYRECFYEMMNLGRKGQ